MIFKPELIEAMREGRKTQTRRVKRDGDYMVGMRWGHLNRDTLEWERGERFKVLRKFRGERRWGWLLHYNWVEMDRRYAIQPGRGKKAVGSFECVGLQEEQLQEISSGDAIVDAAVLLAPTHTWMTHAVSGFYQCPVDVFWALWDSIAKKGERWGDNPTVWVIEMGNFEWGDKCLTSIR